jgi:hypothetical protein
MLTNINKDNDNDNDNDNEIIFTFTAFDNRLLLFASFAAADIRLVCSIFFKIKINHLKVRNVFPIILNN